MAQQIVMEEKKTCFKMQVVDLLMEMPAEPFKLVPETRKDIEKRIKAYDRFEKRRSEQNQKIRLAHNLTFDFPEPGQEAEQQEPPEKQEARQ